MAASASMQSVILPLSVTYGATKTNKSVTVSRLVAPTLLSYPHMMRVSSTAKDGQKEQPSTVTKASKIPPPPLTSSSSPPKASTKFWDLFAFSGPVPERTNGRLAMVGFVSALVVELYRGQDVFSQISNGGVSSFVAISILISVASLIPLLQGVSVESKSDGIMTPDAELWNGRMAMLGLVALAFTEYMTGTTLV